MNSPSPILEIDEALYDLEDEELPKINKMDYVRMIHSDDKNLGDAMDLSENSMESSKDSLNIIEVLSQLRIYTIEENFCQKRDLVEDKYLFRFSESSDNGASLSFEVEKF